MYNREVIKAKVIEVLAEQFPNYDFLNNDLAEVKLQEIGLDSIKLIKMIVLFEVAFDMEFEDDDLDISKYVHISDFVNYIEMRVKAH